MLHTKEFSAKKGTFFSIIFWGETTRHTLWLSTHSLNPELRLGETELLLLTLCNTYKESNNNRNILHIAKEPYHEEYEKGHDYNDREIYQYSSKGIRSHNHLVCKRTLN